MHIKKIMNRLACYWVSIMLLALWPIASYAHNHFIRINELMAGYNGDSNFQFIEIAVLSDTDNGRFDHQRQWGPRKHVSGRESDEDGQMMLVFHDVLGNETGHYIFPHHAPSDPTTAANVPGDSTNKGRTVLVATQVFVDTMAAEGFPIRPDYIMPALIMPISGKVCLKNNPRGRLNFPSNQCVSYGGFQGSTETTKASFNSTSFTNKAGRIVAAPNRGLPIVIDPSNSLFTSDSNLNTSGGLLTHAVSLTRVRNNGLSGSTAFPNMGNANAFDNTDFELRRPTPSSTRSINNGSSTQLDSRVRNDLGETNFTFPLTTMAEQGRFLFEQETFEGNGRTCVDCHRPPHFGLTPTQVDALQASRDGINLTTASNDEVRDFFTPLFIGEFNLNTLKLTGTSRPSDLHGVIRDSAGRKALVVAGNGDTYLIYGGLDFNVNDTVTDEGVVMVPEYDARLSPTPSTAETKSTTTFTNNIGTIASITAGDLGDVTAGNSAGLEHPAMMKDVTASGFKRSLIVENVNGIDREHMLRSVPHLIDIAMSGPYGWSPTEGGSPDLGGFCNGAIQQHGSRTLFRRHMNDTNPDSVIASQFIASSGNEFGVAVPADQNTFQDIDVRIMTRDEIRAMDAFQRQVGASQMVLEHFNLTPEQIADFVPTQADLSPANVLDFSPIATTLAQRRGEELFFGTALCSVCHNGPALANTDGRFGTVAGGSGSFDTGSADVELGDNLPDEKTNGGARRLFNVSPLIGIVTTPPYFHNHSAHDLLAAVTFYDTPEFLNSSAAAQLSLSPSNPMFQGAEEITDVTAFLESLVDLPFTFNLQDRAVTAWATNVTADAPINFGTVSIGNTSSAMTVVIQNISGSNLQVLSAVVREERNGLSVDDNRNFSLTSNFTGSALGMTAIDVADVQFHPQNGGLRRASLEVTVRDMDSGETWEVGFALQGISPAGFTVSEVSANTSEAGNTATFTVQLDATPTGDVQIDISSSNEAEGVASPTSLTFTPANALDPQTVTLTGQDDQVIDGTVSYDIDVKVNIGATADVNYQALPAVMLSVDNLDDDVAGFTITPSSGLITTEAGVTDSFTVQLKTIPQSAITVGLAITSNASEVSLSTNSLSFSADASALTPQTVTLTGQDDFVQDGHKNFTVAVSITNAGSDPDYGSVSTVNVTGQNQDDDVPDIIVTPTILNVTEAGSSASFTVNLSTLPLVPVTITLSNGDSSEISLDKTVLSLSDLDPVTVTVTGVDDNEDDGDQVVTVALNASSSDPDYGSINPDDVSVIVQNDDQANILVTPTELGVNESGTTASFTVSLATMPLSPVTINISNGDATELSVNKNAVNLSNTSPATVTVTGLDDNDLDGNQTVLLDLSVSSADAKYNVLSPDDVSVIVQDNDKASVLVVPTKLIVNEANGSASFSVSLGTTPASPVTIILSNGNTNELDLDKTLLNLSSTEPAIVTVTGRDDNELDGDQTVAIEVSLSSSDSNYGVLNPSDVTVIVQDDDKEDTSEDTSSGTSLVSFVLNQFSVSEGKNAQVLVNRTGDTSLPASVNYVTTQQTAVAGVQYSNSQGTLTWNANDASSRVIEITTLDDDMVTTGSSNFLISLSNPIGVSFGNYATATVSILNTTTVEDTCGEGGCEGDGEDDGGDDSTDGSGSSTKDIVMFGAAVFTALEGDVAEVSVYRLGAGKGSVSVNYQVQVATADSNDFVSSSGMLSWSDGDLAPKTFNVSLTQDSAVEGTEYLKLQLSNPVNANMGFMSELRIIDDDVAAPVAEEIESAGVISLSSSAFTVGESSGSLNLPLTRSNGSAGAVSVQVQMQAGTATAGADYSGTTLSATWADSETGQKIVSIPILDDSLSESSESFTVSVSILSGDATLGQSTASVTILDNDVSVVNDQVSVLNFSPVQYSANEGDGSVNLSVIREGSPASELQARVIALMGQGANEARAGEDFSYVSTVLTWASGDSSSRSVSINLIDDAVQEGVEKVSFLLLPTSGGAVSSNNQAELTLLDNDSDSGSSTTECVQTIQQTCVLNNGTVLTNPVITSQGHVIGGQVRGNVANSGVLENVQLAAGAQLTGSGRLRGTITGQANAPALLTGQTIDSGAVLSHVIIGAGTSFTGQVQFGEGVQFASADLIPNGMSFNSLLPRASLTGCLIQTAPVWLDGADVIAGGDILGELNDFADPFSLAPPLSQWRNGIVVYVAGSTHYAVVPRQVYQADSFTGAGAEIRRNGEILLTTPSGRTVLTQPALQGECELQAAASTAFGRRVSLQADDSGSVMFARSSTEYMIFRPDFLSVLADSTLVEGFNYLPELHGLANQNLISFVFEDNNGMLRQQHLLPTLADADAFASAVHNLTIAHDGLVSFFANGQAYQAVPSYEVRLMTATGTTQVRVIADMNSDGVDDMEIEYGNGQRQVLYLIDL